jgi:hypothetical protein
LGDVEKPNQRKLSGGKLSEIGAVWVKKRFCGALCAIIGLAALVAKSVAAEPLVSQGIGTSSCERLADDLNPAEGLSNPVNLLLLAWVQGYVSAANVSLLENDGRHVDMNVLDETKVLTLVQTFCKANPDRKAIAAIDDLIRKSAKVKTMWEPGTIEWDQ